MDAAAAKTRNIILTPAIVITWLLGLWLFGSNWEYYAGQPWMWAKVVLVVGLSGFHGYLMGLGKKIAAGERPIEPRRLRALNELPMIIAIFAVIAVVVQPFGA
jgi:putative membrane protein